MCIFSIRCRYLRALAAFYVRLTFDASDVYKTLEPLLADYRKLRRRVREGYSLTYIDQFIDDLLTKDRVCATTLWKLPNRQQLEDLDLLEERISPLGKELDEIDSVDGEENGGGEDDDDDAEKENGEVGGSRSRSGDGS